MSAAYAPSPELPRVASAPRVLGLMLALALLGLLVLVSIAVGARGIPLGDVIDALGRDDGSDTAAIVRDLRVPRTLIGLAVGIALGLAGALMQALTRNPLADPSLLGVQGGAAAAIVTAIGVLGIGSASGYVWFAFLGAALASIVVYVLGSRGRSGPTPVRLALAGTAVAAALTAYSQGMTLVDPAAFDEFRFWAVGAITDRGLDVLAAVGPFLLAGTVIAIVLARPLNALALGDEAGRALGAHIGATRAWGAVAITLLCGGATAIAGPIAFVGLTVPHVARAIVGPDQRWVLAYSMVLAPILLLSADIVGRVVIRPGELEVGIVTALLGAPVFIALVRRRRIAQL
jgi:iron complex transport system permease protein